MLSRFMTSLALAITFVVAGLAQSSDLSQVRVSLRLQNADMHAAVQALMAQTGAQFVFAPANKEFAPVSVSLVDQPLELAVKYICMSAGAVYRIEPGPVFVISQPGQDTSQELSGKTAAVTETVKPPLAPINPPQVTNKIFMKHAHPKDVLNALFLRERDPYAEAAAVLNWLNGGNPMIGRPLTTPTYYNTPINSEPIGLRPTIPNPESGNPATGSNRSDNFVGTLGAQLGGVGGGGQGRGAGGIGQGGGQGTQLPTNSLIPEGISLVSYDPTDNSIVVQGSEEDIEQLRRLIAMFDVRPKQVMVKVEFITATTNRSESFGIDWLYQRVDFSAGNTPGTFAVTNDPIFVNFASGNIVSRLRARLVSGEGKVVNAPLITTLNNQPATIQQQILITIFINQLISTGNGQVISEPVPQQVPVVSGLSVAPRVNRDGTITLTVAPQIADLGQIRKGPNNVEFPDIITQSILVTRIIKDGETMVLGGLTRKQNSVSYQRYPILGDLPIIGQFFRSKSKIIDESELLIFITPSVIPDDDAPTGIGP